MGRFLLDINVLIALLDPNHVFHDRAHVWWADNRQAGWASCPLTENGVIRIMSQPAYSKQLSFAPADLMTLLRSFTTASDHVFWADEVSMLDPMVFNSWAILGHRQLTDLYLLALAVRQGGILCTFDANINPAAVHNATPAHIICP
jgi:toxin-antitoxin system PIN domain toxin